MIIDGVSVVAGQPASLPDPGEALPRVAWPTVALFAGALVLATVSTAGYFAGALPAVVVVLLNAVSAFVMFTVLHDASHHALGRSDALNEILGRASMLFVSGLASFGLFRYIHIEHHRNTNEEGGSDPDRWCSQGPTWQHPLRWLVMDAHYIAFWLRRVRQRPRAEVIESLALFGTTTSLLVWVAASGHLLEAVLLYVIPQRLAGFVLAWWFDYLPHQGLAETTAGNRFRCTRNRVGLEWLLTPMMLSQNYHLVHHLHPSIPFYTYLRTWRRNEAAYMARDAAVSTAWGRELTRSEYLDRRELRDGSLPAPDAATRGRFHALKVARVDRLTADSVAITFDVPAALRETFRYTQGQHLTIRCTRCGDGDTRRSYSICAPVSAQSLRIGVRHVPGGAFSSYALQTLQAGDTLDVLPPSGRFGTPLDPRQARRYAAIAVGSGITPILSIVATTLEVEPNSTFVVLFGNRHAGSVMFRAELAALEARHPKRLQVLHFLSAPRPGDPDLHAGAGRDSLSARVPRELLTGRIDRMSLTHLLETVLPAQAIDDWFLCGPQALVDSVRATLRRHGAVDANIHHELFIAASARKPDAGAAPAAGAARAAITIKAGGRDTQFELPLGGATVLDAAMRLRDDLPYSCLGGACGTCRARLCSGTVEMEQNFALDASQLAAGYVLTCQSKPTSAAVVLDFDG